MHLILKYFRFIFVIFLSLIFISWGYQGHYKISGESKKSFNEEMTQFMEWASLLAEHASDADDRKDTDPNEGPRHYIDIDNYPFFAEQGRIPQTWDSVVEIYGESFVIDQGILPWATKTTYDSLVKCFLRRDWDKAVLFASDLGHYVADGHMPLHITMNYNGQFTGNTGIHSRYESSMINTFISQINYEGQQISFIPDVNEYIFSYLYANYVFVDSVLAADDYAKVVSGGSTSSYAYKEALWNKTKNFTIPLFSSASHSLAELFYSAWVEAGKPDINASGIGSHLFKPPFNLELNYPNPFSNFTEISFSLEKKAEVSLLIYDASGKIINQLTEGELQKGEYNYQWNATDSPNGLYYLVLSSGGHKQVQKMIVLK